jgi:phosphoribosyl 1,2-cyclic phosphodiesterase
MDGIRVRLKFWGVRGSTPTPQIENLKFGGNTSCIELRTAQNECLILDGGSGIRGLGQCLVKEAKDAPVDAKILLTHYHWDHIQGIPFFAPLYGPKNHITFFAGSNVLPIRETLEGQMTRPYFPIDFGQVAAKRDFCQLEDGAALKIGEVTVRPFPLNHPQGASGYRLECGDSVIVYATDYEHGNREFDDILNEYSQNADVLICDAQYTPAEYESHRGWGHSTWENAVMLARDVKAEHLILFHHDPIHDDQMMMRISQDARIQFENTTVAWEGFVAAL